MNRNRFWMLGAFILVSAALVGATIKVRQNPLYQLSRYSQTPAFERFIFRISEEMDIPIVGVNQAMLNIYEPANGDFKKVLEYQVTPGTQFNLNVISFPNNSGGYGRTASLSDAQSKRVKTLMRQLPPSAPPDNREDLLVVLLYKRSNSQLRLYDRHHPPRQVSEIARILTQIVDRENRGLIPDSAPPYDLPHLKSKLQMPKTP